MGAGLISAVVRMLFVTGLLLFPSIGAAQLRFEAQETDTGIRFIMVSGYFDAADDFEDFIRLVEAAPTEGVSFDSKGGDTFKAMEFGRLIRRLGLSTTQPWVNDCLSACAWAFIGGSERLASEGGIGVHQTFIVGQSDMAPYEAVSAVQKLTAELMRYIVEMGVDLSMLELALRYQTHEIRYLTKAELDAFRLNWDHPGTDGG